MYWHHFLVVAVGGAIGACCRYAVTVIMLAKGHEFPWSTVIVNVFGSLVAGFLRHGFYR